ncbi:MAG: hypothetical protein OES46_10175 [Gammaproteobacteria bacterium]|jgi:c(7)-type cytochrome triheme protein|nr:hypothetical protein [Gammaproteobacteria bacterium]
MQTWPLALVIAIVIAVMSGVYASPPGQDLQWKTTLGVVAFSTQSHASAGNQCPDCHDLTGGEAGIFAMKYGTSKLTMAEMNEGKGCGTCHNGQKVFGTADPAACTRCHQPQ